jgi:hypothetical protein
VARHSRRVIWLAAHALTCSNIGRSRNATAFASSAGQVFYRRGIFTCCASQSNVTRSTRSSRALSRTTPDELPVEKSRTFGDGNDNRVAAECQIEVVGVDVCDLIVIH